MGGSIVTIEDKTHWDKQLDEAGSKPVIIDFTATWCGPCRMIGPYFEQLSSDYPSVVFLKVDVDTVEAVAAECGISAMPTFQVWKEGKKLKELVGASKEKLVALIEEHSQEKLSHKGQEVAPSLA